MPIYEYQCTNCGHTLEEFQSHSEKPLTICPNCGKENLQKLISLSSFQLKGTGWYVTDIRDKNKPKTKETTGEEGNKKPEEAASKNESSQKSEKVESTKPKDESSNIKKSEPDK